METSQYIQEITNRLFTYSGKEFDICSDIMSYIDEAPADIQEQLFIIVCRHFGESDSTKPKYTVSPSKVSPERQNELEKMYGETVDSLIEVCIKRSLHNQLDADRFYADVWNSIVCNSLFTTQEDRIFAAYYVLIDKRIPFFTISEGLTMKNEEFRRLISDCKDSIQKIKFILALDFEQKTQEASNLLDVILNQDTYEKQAVLFARILAEVRKDGKELVSDLIKRLR